MIRFINKNLKVKNIWILFTSLLFLFPLLNIFTHSLIVGCWLIFSVLIFYKNGYLITKHVLKLYTILVIPLILQVIGFVLSEDKSSALLSIEKNLLFLVLPIGFLIGRNFLKRKHLFFFLVVFIVSCFTLNSYVIGYLLINGYFLKIQEANYFNPIFRNVYAQLTGTHLPYLGLWFLFSCISIVYLLLQLNLKFFLKLILVFIAVQLLVGTFIFSARMAIAAFILTLISSFIIYFRNFKKTLILIFISIIILFCISRIPTISYRIDELVNTEFQPPQGKPWDPNGGKQYNSTNIRIGIVICSFELLKENWLFGLGQSEVQNALNQCYDRFKMEGHDDFKSNDYNTHNQYIHFWLSSGLFGFLLFIALLTYMYIRSHKKQDILLFAFTLFLTICFMTENILARYAGVVFFSLFSALLLSMNSLSNKNE